MRRSTVNGRMTSWYLPRLKVSRIRSATPQMKLTFSPKLFMGLGPWHAREALTATLRNGLRLVARLLTRQFRPQEKSTNRVFGEHIEVVSLSVLGNNCPWDGPEQP